MVTKKGSLRPIDFEGACLINRPDPMPWTTLRTDSRELNEFLFEESNAAVDLFALGAVFYLLIEGKSPTVGKNAVPKISRRNVPDEIKKIIAELLEPEKARHLEIGSIARQLNDLRHKAN